MLTPRQAPDINGELTNALHGTVSRAKAVSSRRGIAMVLNELCETQAQGEGRCGEVGDYCSSRGRSGGKVMVQGRRDGRTQCTCSLGLGSQTTLLHHRTRLLQPLTSPEMIHATNPVQMPYTIQLSDLDGDNRVNRSARDRRCSCVASTLSGKSQSSSVAWKRPVQHAPWREPASASELSPCIVECRDS